MWVFTVIYLIPCPKIIFYGRIKHVSYKYTINRLQSTQSIINSVPPQSNYIHLSQMLSKIKSICYFKVKLILRKFPLKSRQKSSSEAELEHMNMAAQTQAILCQQVSVMKL